MPQKINMIISNGNAQPMIRPKIYNTESLAVSSTIPTITKAPSSLNAPILARIHNVRPGCGSCGRH
jgi:hypothetical protein